MSEVGAGSANGRTLRTLSLTHDKMAEFLLEEQAENEFSLFSWPSGEILAAHVLQHHDSIKGKRVVELGAGIALPSAAACRCGAASVEATDAAYAAPEAATLCRRNLDRNGASAVAIRSLKWSSDADGSAADGLEADILLGADVFYEPDEFVSLLITVSSLLRRSPAAVFWTAYHERSSTRSIAPLLSALGLEASAFALPDLASPERDALGRYASVRLFQIRLRPGWKAAAAAQ